MEHRRAVAQGRRRRGARDAAARLRDRLGARALSFPRPPAARRDRPPAAGAAAGGDGLAAAARLWTDGAARALAERSEEHTSELQSLMRISYAVFCLKKKNNNKP